MNTSHLCVPKLAAALCAAASCAVAAVTATAFADAGGGELKFLARGADIALTGRFDRFAVDVDLDPQHPQTGSIKVAIDLTSVDAGGADANTLLKGKEFFDVTRFPSATFVSSSVLATGGGNYRALGVLTMKGHSANFVIPFTVRPDSAGGSWFEGGATLSRRLFAVGEGQWADVSTLEDEVRIQFKVHGAR